METKKAVNYKDLTDERNEYLFKMPSSLEQFFLSHLINSKDIVMLRLVYNITVVLLPSALLMYVLRTPPVWLGVAHGLALFVLFFQRFILTLHFASHKALFNSKWFDYYLQYVICPFFGLPSGAYRTHHCVMHHVENNVFPYDVSSTMPYQRDNPLHFVHYWLRFMLAIWVQLPYYAYIRGRYKLFLHTVLCISSYLVTIYFLYCYSPSATMFVFIIPYLVCSFLLMLGNWCQHIFIDPERYDDSYALTYNLINTPMNKLTYNDGYHVVHHIHSQLHWSELPNYFLKNQDKFIENRALTFEGMEYLQIGWYAFLGRYDELAKRYVHLGEESKRLSKEELTDMFKRWLMPIQAKQA